MLCSVFVHFSFFFFQQPLWEKRALHQKCLAHRAEDFVSIVSIVLLVHCPVHENLTFPYWSSSGLFQFYYIVESWQRSNNLSPAFVQPLWIEFFKNCSSCSFPFLFMGFCSISSRLAKNHHEPPYSIVCEDGLGLWIVTSHFFAGQLYWWKHVVNISIQGGRQGGEAPQLWRNDKKSAPFGQNFALSRSRMLVNNRLCVGQPPKFFLLVCLWW